LLSRPCCLGMQIEVTSAQRIEFFVSAAFDDSVPARPPESDRRAE
jgi:hypothetical protein